VNDGIKRDVYVDGELWLDGNAGALDDRHSLDPTFLVLADESADEDNVSITTLALWDEPLDADSIAALGGPAPDVVAPHTGPLTLLVDGDSGGFVLRNNTSLPVDLAGYTIATTNALAQLNPAQGVWNSLADQGQPGWQETQGTATVLAETAAAGPLSVGASTSIPIGNPFSFTPTEFGQDPANSLSFQFSIPGLSPRTGPIEFDGNRNTLVLRVDPATGMGIMQNLAVENVDIISYTIFSPDGSLRGADGQWLSFADQSIPDWDEANIDPTHRLSETNPTDVTTLAVNQSIPLGMLFGIGAEEDLEFQFQRASDGRVFTGSVVYGEIEAGLFADLNGDGVVDRADAAVLLRGMGTTGQGLIADLNGDDAVGLADLALLQSSLGNTQNLSPAAQSVPEPGGAFLWLATMVTATVMRTRRSARGFAA
jgi:hypothetical protein